MRLRRIIILLSILAVLCSCTGTLAAESEDLAVTNGCHSLDGAIPLLGQEKWIDNAQSIVLYETNSQTLLYTWDADKQLYPASFVKLMTALLVFEQGKLDDVVTVSQQAIGSVSYDAISVDLQEGEQVSVRDLLYCMLVYSANDAAAVLAEYVSGSQSAFVALMNERAQELCCNATYFVNAHGLHDELQLTSARDTARILEACLKFEEFRTIFSTIKHTVEKTNLHDERNLTTKNYLMCTDSVAIHYDDRVTGGRTGETADGYRCVASVSQSGTMEVICIVMGSRSTYSENGYSIAKFGGFDETSDLLDRAYDGYSMQQVIFKNQILRQQPVTNGDSDVFMASYEDFSTVLPSGVSFDQLSYRYSDIPGSTEAPIKKGQNVAALQVWYGAMCIAQTDIYAMNDVPVAYVKTAAVSDAVKTWRIGPIIIVIVFILIVVAAAVLLLQRQNRRRHIRYRSASRRRR